MGLHTGKLIKRQSLNERLNKESVELGKLVLLEALNLKPQPKRQKLPKKLSSKLGVFNKIMIRDITVQQLSDSLSELFSGSFSHGNATALTRIQALFNFTDMKWVNFQIAAFTDNDQGAADCVENFLAPKDLLLQDLGYFKLGWIKTLIKKQYLITKWHLNAHLFTQSDVKIDLNKLLKDEKRLIFLF
jgi:hypothetical protein